MTLPNRPQLLERDDELSQLVSVLGAAAEGRGGIVLIEGAPGQGKTGLLNALRDAADSVGYATLYARATELERSFAFGCVRQLLEAELRRRSPWPESLFAGAAELARPLFDPTMPIVVPSGPDLSFDVMHGLYWLIDNLSQTAPVLLTIDDLQWSDPESVRFLSYVTPRLDGLRAVVAASIRSGEIVSGDLAQIAALPEAQHIRLKPLSATAVKSLCDEHFGQSVPADLVAACHEVSGGNPFYVQTVLREAVDLGLTPDTRATNRVRHLGPAPIARAVLLRVGRTSDAAVAVARAAAILGHDAGIGEIAGLAGATEPATAEAIDVLVGLDLLRWNGSVEFVHPIVREAIYADMRPAERALAHAAAADLLSRRGAADERVAAQILRAPPSGRASRVALLLRVARAALGSGAPQAAVEALRRAVAEPPPPDAVADVLLNLGVAELRCGDPESLGHLAAAADLGLDDSSYLIAVRLLALGQLRTGNAGQAVATIESAAEQGERWDREEALLLDAELSYYAQHAGRAASLRAEDRLARWGDVDGSSPAEGGVRAALAGLRAKQASSARAASELIEPVMTAWEAPDLASPAGAFINLVVGLIGVEDFDLATEGLERALALSRERGTVADTAYLLCNRGWVALRRGAVAQAESDAATAFDLFTEHREFGVHLALGVLIQARIEMGDLDGAEKALMASDVAEHIPPTRSGTYLLEGRGALHLARGDKAQALRDLLELGRRVEIVGSGNPRAARWRSRAALAHAALGDHQAARRMSRDDVSLARDWGAPGGLGLALRVAALIDAEGSAEDILRQSVDVLERAQARLEHAASLVELGALLRRGNRRADARPILRQGLTIATQCGATALEERALTELRAAGERAADRGPAGFERLTVSERRVADMAAAGRSNPEIAQLLFVSRKTVETHLGQVYRKLGVAGRHQLAKPLADIDDHD